MILFNNIISNAMRIRNLIFIVFFICGSNFCFAKANTEVPFSFKSTSLYLVKKDTVVRLQNEQSFFLKHSLNKNKKHNHNIILSIFEIEEEDSSSFSLKVFKLYQNSSVSVFNSTLVYNIAPKKVDPARNIFSFKKSKLFIDYQSFLI